MPLTEVCICPWHGSTTVWHCSTQSSPPGRSIMSIQNSGHSHQWELFLSPVQWTNPKRLHLPMTRTGSGERTAILKPRISRIRRRKQRAQDPSRAAHSGMGLAGPVNPEVGQAALCQKEPMVIVQRMMQAPWMTARRVSVTVSFAAMPLVVKVS